MRCVIAGLAAVFCLVRFVPAADDDYFHRQELIVDGVLLTCLAGDYNGDGRTDVALLTADNTGQRFLQSYVQREGDRFPPGPVLSIKLSPTVNFVQAIDLTGDGFPELAVMDHDGIWYFEHDDYQFSSQPKRLIEAQTILVGAVEDRIFRQDFILPVNGRLMAIIPISGGFSIWSKKSGRFEKIDDIDAVHVIKRDERPVKLFGGIQPNGFELLFPKVKVHDGNGDGLDDLYFLWDDRLIRLGQNEKGEFPPARIHSHIFDRRSDDVLIQSELVDLSGDGRLDLIASRSVGGIADSHTDVSFYRSTPTGSFDAVADFTVTLADACGNLMVGDFDRTGGQELVVPAMELGIMSAVKMMISKKTDMHLLFYPIDANGRPAENPTVHKKFPCRLNFDTADPTSDIRVNWDGDYDGDGHPDLILADGNGQLMFYSGHADDYLDDKASLVIDLESPDEIIPVDLNGDDKSDLMVLHKRIANRTKLTLLITSRIR
jgi:hypothetical protein